MASRVLWIDPESQQVGLSILPAALAFEEPVFQCLFVFDIFIHFFSAELSTKTEGKIFRIENGMGIALQLTNGDLAYAPVCFIFFCFFNE